MVQSLDENIGRLLNTLDELGLTEKTIVVFFADNGGVHWNIPPVQAALAADSALARTPITSNAPLRGGKATAYEGGTREPCVVVWPGITQAGTAMLAQANQAPQQVLQLLRG